MAHATNNGEQLSFTPYPDWGTYMPGYITLSRLDYAALLQIAQDHESLKDALYRGGVAPETLEFLIYGNTVQRKDSGFEGRDWTTMIDDGSATLVSHENTYLQVPSQTYDNLDISTTSRSTNGAIHVNQFQPDEMMHEPSLLHDHEDDELEYAQEDSRKGQTVGTLQITGLSDLMTHKDLTDAIRGGPVVSIAIHKNHTATVAMLNGAADFLAHVKRHDLYVQCKRLQVRRSHRQYKLSEHIQRQMNHGATRNLVIRNGANRLSEERIRDDMEHIDKLVLIAVVIRGPDIYLYTNSVAAALFARTCMLSRKGYNNLRVEHFPDDCAGALPTSQNFRLRPPPGVCPPKSTVGNMFDVLATGSDSEMDSNSCRDNHSDQDGESESSGDEIAVFARLDDDDAVIDDSESEGVRLSDY